MNGYQRYLAVLRGETPDHLPRLPILMAFAANYIKATYAEFASDHRVLVEANLRAAADFGFDQVSAISDPYRETHGFGAEIEYVRDGVPRCVRPPLLETKALDTLPDPDPNRSERMRDRILAIKAYRLAIQGRYSILGWVEGPAAEAANLRGITNFLMDLMDDAAFVRNLLEVCLRTGVRFALAQIEAGADTVGIGDAICSQISPATYRDIVLPYEQRLIAAIHGAGSFARLHICGDVTHLLPWIAETGADIIDLDWKVSLAAASLAFDPRTVLTGNLDPVAAIKNGTPATIRALVNRAYAEAGNPYMVGAGCEIPAGTPPENLTALCTPIPYDPARTRTH